ncbi:MAG: hypothetical protein JW827_01100 [Spirochaetes bacterium]|nr:hypothetical protein [Spirochaetota bacterium]
MILKEQILFLFILLFLSLTTANYAWELDPAFDGDGVVSHRNAGGLDDDEQAYAITIDSNGKIVAAGYTSGNFQDLAVWRYNEDGSLDLTFSNKGYVVHDNAAGGNAGDIGEDVVIDRSNRIVVSGRSIRGGSNWDMTIWRFREDGSLDTSFNGQGWVFHNGAAGGNDNDVGYAVLIDKSNKIVVAGASHNGAESVLTIWRYYEDGTLDTSFSNKGWTSFHLLSSGITATFDTNERIVISGSLSGDMGLWRYNIDGSLDTSFSNKGWVVHVNAAGGGLTDVGTGIAIDRSNRIVIGGYSYKAAFDMDMVVWRYNDNGSIDTNFGTTNKGFILHHNAGGAGTDDRGYDLTLDRDNKILVTGFSKGGADDMVIWRLNEDGSLDTGFYDKGWVVFHNGAGGGWDDQGDSILIDANDRILVGGASYGPNDDYDMTIWRLRAGSTVSTNGITYDQTGIYPNYLDISQDNTCRILIMEPGNAKIKIYNASGFLIKEYPERYYGSGNYEVWDGKGNSDKKVGSGVYIVIIEGDNIDKKLKMIIKK